MTLEMGKTLKSAIAEVEKCAWVCRYYADEAAGFLQDEAATTDASHSYVRFLPLGPLLARHALELSFLAGVSRRCACPNDGQSSTAQACV